MTKSEFISAIKATEACADMTKKDIEAVLSGVNDVITEVVASEGSVKLGSIGTFPGYTRPAKTARSPRDGSTIQIPEKHGYPKFKFASNMKVCE